MDETARLLLDKLESFERRIARLELLVLPQQQQQPQQQHSPPHLHSFAVSNADNVFFHYKDRSFTEMQSVLDQLIGLVRVKKTRNRKVHIYAEFVSGRPDMHVDGGQLGDGFKILLFVVTPGITTVKDDLFRSAHYDAQVTITLDASFVRIDSKKSDREVQKLSQLLQ